MSLTSIAEQIIAMILFVMLSKVAGQMATRYQSMPAMKKNMLIAAAAIAMPAAMNCIALFFSARALHGLINSPDPLTRIDVFLISLLTLTTFQLFWAIWFGEAVRSRWAHLVPWK